MANAVDDGRIGSFLTDLQQCDNSVSARAYAAYFIGTHREAIESHLARKIDLSGASYSTIQWAKQTRKLMDHYETGPKGYMFNPRITTLESLYQGPARSFRLARGQRHSLTLATRQRIVQLAGYVVTCVAIGAILWLGFTLKRALEEFGHIWVAAIEERLAE